MNATINAKQLRASLPEVVEKVRRGARFTVLYRSRPAFQVVPVDEPRTCRAILEAIRFITPNRSFAQLMAGAPQTTTPSFTANEGAFRGHRWVGRLHRYR